jgi:regulator of RNase E activity RraA
MTKAKVILVVLATLAVVLPGRAQVFKLTPEQMIKYTANNPFDRFEDGRPKVPDAILERVKDMSMEEVWGVERKGFPSQYVGEWKILHPDKKLVGRAVTLMLVPFRPEIAEVDHTGMGVSPGPGGPRASGTPSGGPRPLMLTHQTALDMLRPGDVFVVDARAIHGGVIGDNLATYIKNAASGFVIDGMIRDLDGIKEIDMAGYYREAVPPALTNCMVAGINIPVTIGNVTVLPGDVVLGDAEGVYFIPPSQVKELVEKADEVHVHDEWTKMKFGQGSGPGGYKSTDIYGSPHDPALIKEYQEYLKVHLEEIQKKRQ